VFPFYHFPDSVHSVKICASSVAGIRFSLQKPAPKLRKKLISVQSNLTLLPPKLFKYPNKNADFAIAKPIRAPSLHRAHAYT
jgi:hypothetical protein